MSAKQTEFMPVYDAADSWLDRFIRNGEIGMDPFVAHQFPISRVQDAFDLAESRGDGALKVSLTF